MSLLDLPPQSVPMDVPDVPVATLYTAEQVQAAVEAAIATLPETP